MNCDAIQVISRPETTLAAVGAALELLQPSGLVSVLAYTGHPGVWGMLPPGSCCYAAGTVVTAQHIVALDCPTWPKSALLFIVWESDAAVHWVLQMFTAHALCMSNCGCTAPESESSTGKA